MKCNLFHTYRKKSVSRLVLGTLYCRLYEGMPQLHFEGLSGLRPSDTKA